jgi:hypothetical protein
MPKPSVLRYDPDDTSYPVHHRLQGYELNKKLLELTGNSFVGRVLIVGDQSPVLFIFTVVKNVEGVQKVFWKAWETEGLDITEAYKIAKEAWGEDFPAQDEAFEGSVEEYCKQFRKS